MIAAVSLTPSCAEGHYQSIQNLTHQGTRNDFGFSENLNLSPSSVKD
tara:strand:+ start:252 stop:392 length:141 start_codon:yes stop_codon:yes gene_type:complete